MLNILTDFVLNLELYKKMFLIRKAEEHIQKNYSDDEMKTPMHMSMGGEAITAGICQALESKGLFFGTYRSHALYLAITGETDQFFAELYGKEEGASGGKAGSMHLACPEKGLILTSAVVGTNIPIAVGSALASKRCGDNKISVAFFGDGAVDEGVFWESLNAACLWKLPIIFVCEDNDLAIHISKSKRRGYQSLKDLISGFDCLTLESCTTDVKTIYTLAQKAVTHVNQNSCPVFLNLRYYRYLEHVGITTDFRYGYRSEEEFKSWAEKDPLKIQREFLVNNLGLGQKVLELEHDIEQSIKTSILKAQEALFPNNQKIRHGVYHD